MDGLNVFGQFLILNTKEAEDKRISYLLPLLLCIF